MRGFVHRLCLALIAAAAMPAAASPSPLPQSLVPRPLQMNVAEGTFFELGPDTTIVVDSKDPEVVRTARYLAAQLQKARGLQLPVVLAADTQQPKVIVFRLQPPPYAAGEEGYELSVSNLRIVVRASQPHGLFNGAISLLQLATNGGPGQGPVDIAAVSFRDHPRFAWRGLMLDSARHMQSVQEIKDFLDAMALHKLSVMQWHLTDDQGWRLQIRKYPKLTEVGAWRIDAGAAGVGPDGKPQRYGGFYTQEQVREIVAYAAERYITVVPEIDLPGHAQAAVAAYPQFGNVDKAPPVSPDWGVHEYLFNVEEPTLRFLEDVLAETMELFPSKFIHVGGDEAVKTQWKNSPRVQARMKELGIADETKLQAWLTGRMEKFLAAHGRRLIGWDEILEGGGLPPDAAVMSWRGTDGAVAATKAGHDSVLSPWPLLYFDNRQGTGPEEPPGRIRVVSLEDVYRFDPLPPAMDAAQARHLLGVQGNLWSEHIRTAERIDWMAFPRGAAIAEMGWSDPGDRQWEDFLRRLPGLYASYDALGIRHADSPYAVLARTTYAGGHATVALTTQTGSADIRYTLDGSEPRADSPEYSGPLSLDLPSTLKAAGFAGGQRVSQVLELPLRGELAQHRAARELKLCTENIAIGIEDDGPAQGPRATFPIDIQNPCWIFEGAELDAPMQFRAGVGSIPFNFQIGDLKDKIVFAKPQTPAGELLVLLDKCDGEELARLPLAPAAANSSVSVLPPAALRRVGGRHDICLRFAQPALQPMWALDWVQLDMLER